MRGKRLVGIVTAFALTVGLLAACGAPKETGTDEEVTIKYWCSLPATVRNIASSFGETEVYKELQKRTGVTIDFIHPAAGSDNEQFNVMLASGDLPDVIERDWSSYIGAEEKAAEDGILMDITEYVNDYAPNMVKFIEKEVPDAKRWITTNDRYYIIPSLEADKKYVTTIGMLIRQDLLDKYGLEMPKTIADWENVLRTFKENGVKYPLSLNKNHLKWYSVFECAYGVTETFLQRDGRITYGYIEPEMKDFVITMKRWFEEGLVDPDMLTMDEVAFNGKVLNGDAGAWVGSVDDIAVKEKGLKEVVPDANIVGAPYMSLNEGEDCKVVYLNRRDGYTYANAAGITTSNKHPKATIKMFDYLFTDEGAELMNYGVEGKSYEMVDGKPTFTELITNNSDGLSTLEARGLWTRYNGPGRVELGYMDQVHAEPDQKNAAQMWSDQAVKYDHAAVWRACYKLTADEADELTEVTSQFTTFATENFSKFIMGLRPIEEWDAFVADLKAMGVDRAIEIYQTAYDRIMKD